MLSKWRTQYLAYARLTAFKRRVTESQSIIRQFLEQYPKAYVSWSAGKDSTALMHMVWRIKPYIKIMSEKDDMDFPDELDYVKMMQKKYNLNLDIISPDVKLWDIVQNYPIDEDIHSRTSQFSKTFFYDLIERYKAENDVKGVFLGLRAEESKGRRKNFKKRGFIYHKLDGDIVCQPLAKWKSREIFAYLFSRGIPILSVYFKTHFVKSPEDIRKSWILPSVQTSQGQALWLKYYYPDIFQKLSQTNPEILRYV